jgi:hypothetical protein
MEIFGGETKVSPLTPSFSNKKGCSIYSTEKVVAPYRKGRDSQCATRERRSQRHYCVENVIGQPVKGKGLKGKP